MKRFKRINRTVQLLVVSGLCLHLINDDYLHLFPSEMTGYFFWLTLGLYLGVQWYSYSSKKYWKEQEEINSNSSIFTG